MPDSPADLHSPSPAGGMGLEEARRLTTGFLTGPMAEVLRFVDYPQPDWRPAGEPVGEPLERVAMAEVTLRHVPGASDALYRVKALGEVLSMKVQLNVWRFVIVYTIPASELVDATAMAPRFERWQTGAAHAGWTIGWRDAVDPWDHDRRQVEVYCYAMLPRDFLADPLAQLYWRTDIVQMTRGFMLEARRLGVALSRGGAG